MHRLSSKHFLPAFCFLFLHCIIFLPVSAGNTAADLLNAFFDGLFDELFVDLFDVFFDGLFAELFVDPFAELFVDLFAELIVDLFVNGPSACQMVCFQNEPDLLSSMMKNI